MAARLLPSTPLRLALLLLLVVPLLVGLSHFIGFEDTFGWKDDVVDAFAAYAVGFIAAAPVLLLFGVITSATSAAEIVGKVAVQAVPGSIGALLTQSEFGASGDGSRRKEVRGDTYGGELFFMCVGAVFLSLNVAPTEEMILISYQMTPWHALALCARVARRSCTPSSTRSSSAASRSCRKARPAGAFSCATPSSATRSAS